MTQTADILIATLPIDPNNRALFVEANARLDAALNRMPAVRRIRIEEGDDLTFYDQDGLRIGLSSVFADKHAFLTLAIGMHPDANLADQAAPINEVFLRALLRIIMPAADTKTILWQEATGILEADMMDEIALELENADTLPEGACEPVTTEAILIPGPAAQFDVSRGMDSHESPRCRTIRDEDVLASLRVAIAEEEEPSMQMKLSAYFLSSAFVFVAPTMGLAMLTYAVLRHVEEVAESYA